MLDRRLVTGLVLVFSGVLLIHPLGVNASSLKDELSKRAPMEKRESRKFIANLPEGFEWPDNETGQLLLREYGAVFLARNGATPPNKIIFEDEEDVQRFQKTLDIESERIGGIKIELQKAAMRSLESAVKQAKQLGITISPRGVDSGRRGYNQTVTLWKSRVEPGLRFWVGRGRISSVEAERILKLRTSEQVSEILRLEREKIFFAKSLDKSIIYSVAPPGTSQHLALLALDVKEFDDPRVRAILAVNGWFQTVVSDLPHFTYVGVKESELAELGLKRVRSSNRDFWIPDLPSQPAKKEPAVRPTPNIN